jgi:TolB-like protein
MIFKLTLISLLTIFLLSGCKQNRTSLNKNYKVSSYSFYNSNEFKDLNKAIDEIANHLLLNINSTKHKYSKIVVTSLVNLDEFEQTSKFGRMVAESLINELHYRKFKVIDFRATEAININESGEFALTRNIDKLKDEMPEALILVGTYSILDKSRLVINTRIVNNFTSDVISTSRVVYQFKDCKPFNLCEKIQNIKPKAKKTSNRSW